MLNEGSLNLSGRQSVSRNVDDVINTSANPVVTLVVTSCTVSGEVVALVHVQVCVHVTLVCSPDSAGHAGPWLLESKHALYVVAVLLLARDRVDDGGLDAEEGEGCGAGLRGSDTAEGCDNVGTGLGLPVCLRAS